LDPAKRCCLALKKQKIEFDRPKKTYKIQEMDGNGPKKTLENPVNSFQVPTQTTHSAARCHKGPLPGRPNALLITKCEAEKVGTAAMAIRLKSRSTWK
jgi:hypothetical protein